MVKIGVILCPSDREIVSGNVLRLGYCWQSPGHSEEGHCWLRALSGEVGFGFLLVKQLHHCVEYLTLEGSRALAVAAFLHVSLCSFSGRREGIEVLVPLVTSLHPQTCSPR